MEQTETEKLQKTVDKAKTLSLLSNLHNLSPPVSQQEDYAGKVAFIEALKVSPRLQNLFLELQGMIFDPAEKKLVRISRPIMNVDGAFRFVKICQHIAEEVEWSNFHEDEINRRIYEYYRTNYPYFTFWHEEYDLDPKDFSYVSTTLMAFIDASFHKAKSGKYINATARVYSEDLLGKTLPTQDDKKRGGILSGVNPFKRKV